MLRGERFIAQARVDAAHRNPLPVWGAVALVGALCGVGALLVTNNTAGAMGGGNPAAIMIRAEEASREPAPGLALPEPRSTRAPATANGSGLAVCVRLCDGFFFPSNSASGDDQSCEAQCPDAPTALYREQAGSDSIEDAVSTTGASYSELPAAGRHQTALDSACTCHRGPINYSAMLLNDPTLRRGDVVMTPSGPVVYEGGQTSSPRREDFVALAKDSTLQHDIRATLSTMRSAAWEKQVASDRVATP